MKFFKSLRDRCFFGHKYKNVETWQKQECTRCGKVIEFCGYTATTRGPSPDFVVTKKGVYEK